MTMHLASPPANITRQLRLPGWRGVLLLVILMAALLATAIAQDAPGAVPGQTSDLLLSLYPDARTKVGTARPPAIGAIMAVRQQSGAGSNETNKLYRKRCP